MQYERREDMRILVNIWLTIFGPFAIGLGTSLGLSVVYKSLETPTIGDVVWVSLATGVMGLSVIELLKRIWQRSDTLQTHNSKDIYQDFVRREPTI